MNSTNHIDPEDLALFALQLLSADDAATIRRHLDQCSECRDELAAVQGDLAIFAMATEMHAPAPAARERFLGAVSREPRKPATSAVSEQVIASQAAGSAAEVTASAAQQELRTAAVVPIERGRSGSIDDDAARRSAGGRVLPWLGWAAAAGLALTSLNLYREREGLRSQVETATHRSSDLELQATNARRVRETLADASAVRVTLIRAKQAPQPEGEATYVAEKGSLIFIASNLEPLLPYKTYELWIIPANGQNPVAAGTFHPDNKGNASVILPDVPKGVVAKAFGVTVEDEGGSRTPTMPILLSGAAAGA